MIISRFEADTSHANVRPRRAGQRQGAESASVIRELRHVESAKSTLAPKTSASRHRTWPAGLALPPFAFTIQAASSTFEFAPKTTPTTARVAVPRATDGRTPRQNPIKRRMPVRCGCGRRARSARDYRRRLFRVLDPVVDRRDEVGHLPS